MKVRGPTLTERFKEDVRKNKARKANPTSNDIDNEEMKTVMVQLEALSEEYQDRIESNDYTPAYPQPGWKEEAMSKTISEVPHLPAIGTEVGAIPESLAAGQRCLGTTFPARLMAANVRSRNSYSCFSFPIAAYFVILNPWPAPR